MSQQSGFSVIELMVSIAVMVTLSYFAVDNLLEMRSIANLAERKTMISNIEEDIRAGVLKKNRFVATLRKYPEIKTCLIEDQKQCPSDPIKFDLWVSENRKLPLKFNLNGSTCKTDSCAIEAELTFRGICAESSRCDKVATSLVEYSIRVDDAVLKRGSVFRSVSARTYSDDNEICRNGEPGQVMLVSDIRRKRLRCVPGPTMTRSVNGVTPSDCVLGKELMVGIDENGAVICEPLKFKGQGA